MAVMEAKHEFINMDFNSPRLIWFLHMLSTHPPNSTAQCWAPDPGLFTTVSSSRRGEVASILFWIKWWFIFIGLGIYSRHVLVFPLMKCFFHYHLSKCVSLSSITLFPITDFILQLYKFVNEFNRQNGRMPDLLKVPILCELELLPIGCSICFHPAANMWCYFSHCHIIWVQCPIGKFESNAL